ncbi:VOC family protein [Actinacidiphila acidipaludis]|uniref:VOC family protein n=1 Tax=Actinacidiphila acidipaludis TaxID=2873382 RepID=A0ABS7Q9T9_9ACTN|nr:VOC family protein [Streptomyces acidipaludis]MBY8879935.1 VOC family protein [Streptomyces acidipaludis]
MSAWANGIAANTLFVEDVAAARKFYLDVFDAPILYEDAHSVVFGFGPTVVNLLQTTHVPELVEPATAASRAAGVRLVFTVAVDDVDAKCAELAAAGVELVNGPMDRPWGPRTASFRDLDGYVWEIAQGR